jgi:hypothetical protein
VLDPFDVGDDGKALPVRKMFHADPEILPHGAGIDARESAGFVV